MNEYKALDAYDFFFHVYTSAQRDEIKKVRKCSLPTTKKLLLPIMVYCISLIVFLCLRPHESKENEAQKKSEAYNTNRQNVLMHINN